MEWRQPFPIATFSDKVVHFNMFEEPKTYYSLFKDNCYLPKTKKTIDSLLKQKKIVYVTQKKLDSGDIQEIYKETGDWVPEVTVTINDIRRHHSLTDIETGEVKLAPESSTWVKLAQAALNERYAVAKPSNKEKT